MAYNWQLKDWPNFTYNSLEIQELLLEAVEKISLLTGGIKELQDENQLDATIRVMLSEALKSSEIEGEHLNKEAVFSSVKNHLGLKPQIKVNDSNADSISRIIVDAYQNFNKKLSKKQINTWHETLFKDRKDIVVGDYRKHHEPMQVVSGNVAKPKIHYEAPPSSQVNKEMQGFIEWFNQTAPGKSSEIKAAPLRAAIAHLYFESIHPYEDGNGRLGRIIAEKALAQSMGYPIILCLSLEINSKKKLYYSSLGQAQRSNEITNWLKYFLQMLISASSRTEELLNFVVKKSKFYKEHQDQLNPRQAKVIKRMLNEGIDGFKGGINATKYMKITKCSKATATRDLSDLLKKNILIKLDQGGRSTSYDLKF